uniref:Uncharacterized protein n=1 Tax=Oreochromis niloticus TaxID=8128 RepID=A0A669B5V0_ORENI
MQKIFFRLKLVDNDTCWKCQEEAGTLVHMLYACRKNDYLWDGIINLKSLLLRLDMREVPSILVPRKHVAKFCEGWMEGGREKLARRW